VLTSEICITDDVVAVRAMQFLDKRYRGTPQTGDALFALFARTPFHRPVNTHHHQCHTHDRPANVHCDFSVVEWNQHSIAYGIWSPSGEVRCYVKTVSVLLFLG
jgi:hypothetical protein